MFCEPKHYQPSARNNQMTRPITAAVTSIRILMDKAFYCSLYQNLKIQPHRPMINVVKIMYNTLLDLFNGIRGATPAVDLRPSGHARLQTAPTCKIRYRGLALKRDCII